ncbi:MAG: acetyl-CoA carboxylase biotin carboxyl carrier protein [Candidatus Omnitrophica bacterium]|nr:acetyl-CoA carboxylase biotin carboxyl carrier protein [Candidatus Omnitrophota bacterium]
MNLKEIKEMIGLMKENDLTELELEKEGLKIRLTRGGSGASNVVYERMPQQVNMGYLPQQQADMNQPVTQAVVTPVNGGLEIKAPMVGTFYRAPSPDAAPFVEVGATVEIGQVICIIEAMKLMNEIKSEIRGKVKAINVENADPIEFGQVLFVIEPV